MKRAKILFVIGLIMILAGGGLLYFDSRKTAKAVNKSYHIDYVMNKCVVAGVRKKDAIPAFDPWNQYTYVFIGPSGWWVSITGEDINGSETWDVTDWIEAPDPRSVFSGRPGDDNIGVSYLTNKNANDSLCSTTTATNDMEALLFLDTRTAGLYSALVDIRDTDVDVPIAAIPTKWHVEGEIQ